MHIQRQLGQVAALSTFVLSTLAKSSSSSSSSVTCTTDACYSAFLAHPSEQFCPLLHSPTPILLPSWASAPCGGWWNSGTSVCNCMATATSSSTHTTTSHITTTKSPTKTTSTSSKKTSSKKSGSATATAFNITRCQSVLPPTITSNAFVLPATVVSSSSSSALTAALYSASSEASPLELDSAGVRYLYDNATVSALHVRSSKLDSLLVYQNGSFVYQAQNCAYGISGSLGSTIASAAPTPTSAQQLAARAIKDPDFTVLVSVVNQCGKPVESASPKLQCPAQLPPGAVSNFFDGPISNFKSVNSDGSGNVFAGTCTFGTGSYVLCKAGSYACGVDFQSFAGAAIPCGALGLAAAAAADGATEGIALPASGVIVTRVTALCSFAFSEAMGRFCNYEYGATSRPCDIPPVAPVVQVGASTITLPSKTYGFSGTQTATVTSYDPSATTEPDYVNVSDNCTSVSAGLGKSVYCCSGACIDGTSIGNPGQCEYWLDLCGDLESGPPSCGANQVLSYGDPSSQDSGDGCCGACCCECQYQRNVWTYNCCDCPAGYQAVDQGTCDGTSSQCVGCPNPGQTLVQSANGTWGCSC